MYTAEDYKSGYGRKPEKAHTSILPYLKAKQVKVEYNPDVKTEGRKDPKNPIPVNQYDEARKEILREVEE